MAIVYAESVIEIAVIQEYVGRPVVNVWHMHFDPELGSDTKEAVVRDFANNWQDHMLDNVVQELVLVRFDWRSLDPNDTALGTMEPDSGKDTDGVLTSEGLPPNVAILVNKRTNNRPRGARDGRSFMAGGAEGQVDERGNLTGPAMSNWETSIGEFFSGIEDPSVTAAGDRWPVVLETTAESRAPGTQSVTVNSRRVTSLTMDPLVSTQRDRLR